MVGRTIWVSENAVAEIDKFARKNVWVQQRRQIKRKFKESITIIARDYSGTSLSCDGTILPLSSRKTRFRLERIASAKWATVESQGAWETDHRRPWRSRRITVADY